MRTTFILPTLVLLCGGIAPDAFALPQAASPAESDRPFRRWFRPDPPSPIPKPAAPKAGYVLSGSSATPTQPKPMGPVRRVQATPTDLAIPPVPLTAPAASAVIAESLGQPLSLQAALYGALTGNPDLVTLRQGSPIANAPSEEAVEVARRFPTTLNPTIWVDYRPITLIPQGTFGNASAGGGTAPHSPYYHSGQNYILVSYRQPFELGHQTRHRYDIARAALDQQRWNVTQAELTTLVSTYRFFQTAAYRREKLRVARDLAEFNDKLFQTLQKRVEANQALAADAVLAKVESRSSNQLVKAARQDYTTALTDLRNQIGIPDAAGTAEPLGEFTLPSYIPRVDEPLMTETALQNRPEVHAARAQVRGAEAAIRLAKGDRIPSPILGPQYAMDEAGVQYVGLVLVSALPIVNNGKPLVLQREAEARRACVALQQAQQRVVSQVRASVVKWNGATELVNETSGLTGELSGAVETLQRLFDEGQADLTKLMQARQRLIQLENAQLDAVWAATQAQADLLLALGTPTLINAMLERAEADAGVPATTAPALAPPPASPSPLAPRTAAAFR